MSCWNLTANICQVCGTFANTTTLRRDSWTLDPCRVCSSCRENRPICSVCQLPIKDNPTAVGDGRQLCSRDAQLVIWDNGEVTRAIYSARQELDRMLARFTTLPSTNVQLAFVDLGQLHELRQQQVGTAECPTLLGTTRSVRFHNKTWRHQVRILRALPASVMVSVYAHELGHVWLHENVSGRRNLDPAAIEGFCELLAYRLMEQMSDTRQMARIAGNDYTKGQVTLFIQNHEVHGFYPILEWARHGNDPLLRENDLDQIRQITQPPPTRPIPRPLRFHAAFPSPTPKVLTLSGVLSATGSRMTALVNGTMIAVGETAHVQLGTNTTVVRCTEIGSHHVVLELPVEQTNVVLRMPDTSLGIAQESPER